MDSYETIMSMRIIVIIYVLQCIFSVTVEHVPYHA